jgi:hypothetical protein
LTAKRRGGKCQPYQEAHNKFWPFVEKFVRAKACEREAQRARVGEGEARYKVIVHTADVAEAGTDGDVFVRFSFRDPTDLDGAGAGAGAGQKRRWTEWSLLSDGADNFERNLTEEFTVVGLYKANAVEL